MPNQYTNKLLTEDEKRLHRNANIKKWRAENPDKYIDYKKAWRERNPEKHRIGHRQRVWRNQGVDINYAQFLVLLQEQDYRCKVCGASINTSSPVDHNHSTGKVRGILCDRCNRALGLLGDSISILESATNYLKGYEL